MIRRIITERKIIISETTTEEIDDDTPTMTDGQTLARPTDQATVYVIGASSSTALVPYRAMLAYIKR